MKKLTKAEKKKKMVSAMALILAIMLLLGSALPFFSGFVIASPLESAFLGSSTSTSSTMQIGGSYTADGSDLPPTFSFGEDLFDIQSNVGFDGAYIIGEKFPINGVVNNLGSSFDGKLVVKSYVGRNYSSYNYIEDYIEVSIPQGGNFGFDIETKLNVFIDYVEISLYDKNNNEVYRNQFEIKPKSPCTNLIGVMGGNNENLKYFEQFTPSEMIELPNNYGAGYTEEPDYIVFLDENNFPKNKSLIDVYSTFIIDDFNLSLLSVEQIELLENWVTNGGVLVVGAGVSPEKTIEKLSFLEDLDFSENITVEMDLFDGNFITLSKYNYEDSDADLQNWEENNESLFTALEVANGVVVVSSGNFSISPMMNNQKTLDTLELFLKDVAEDIFIISSDSLYNTYDSFYYLDNVNGIPYPKEMDNPYVLIFLLTYILAVSPVVYIILKKKDKREMAWVIIPIISVGFTILNVVVANFSVYNHSIINNVAKVEVFEDSNIANADMRVIWQNAKAGDVIFTSDTYVDIEYMDYYNYIQMTYNNTENEISENLIYSKKATEDEVEILYTDKSSWASNKVVIEEDIELDGSFDINIASKDKKFVGTITNNTGRDFYNTYVICNRLIVARVGELLNGETIEVEIDGDTKEPYIGYELSWQYRNSITDKVNRNEISKSEAFHLFNENDFISNYTSYYGTKFDDITVPITLIAVSDEPILDSEFQLNGKYGIQNHFSIFVQNSGMNIGNSDEFELYIEHNSDSVVVPNIFDVYTSHYNGMGYDAVYAVGGDGYVEFEYTLPSISVYNKNIVGANLEYMSYVSHYSDKMKNFEIYNAVTAEWEKIEINKNFDVYKYLIEDDGDENIIKFRSYFEEGSEGTYPTLTIIGGENNA